MVIITNIYHSTQLLQHESMTQPCTPSKGKFLYSAVLRTVQSALHFTSLTDLFTQTPSRLLWEASSHMLQLMREAARTHIHHCLLPGTHLYS